MDLPTCPSCQQSVLDDEATVCPFCGASMTGEPIPAQPSAPAKPVASKEPTKPTATRSQPKTKTTAGKTASAAIEADKATPTKAHQLSPKRTKNRTFRIVCPMCETVGYGSPKAGGREVKCANPECLVPIFTAPQVEMEPNPDATAETSSGMSSGMLIGIIGAVLVVVGGGAWFLFFNGSGGDAISESKPAGQAIKIDSEPAIAVQPDDQSKVPTTPTKDGDEPEAAPVDLRAKALPTMVTIALQRDRNRSKPFCRQLTAEAFALSGDLPGAMEQLEQLAKVGSNVPYYRISPLVVIGWQHLKKNDTAAAQTVIADALTAAESLPEFGQTRLEAAMDLATILVAVDRTTEARKLLQQNRGDGPSDRMAAMLQAIRDQQTYDMDAEVKSLPVVAWKIPQPVAVTRGLLARGFADKALEWARGESDPEVRADCVAAWAAGMARQADKSAEEIAEQLSSEDALTRARALARIVATKSSLKDTSAADEILKTADGLLASTAVPTEYTLPDIKTFQNSLELGNPVTLRLATRAAAELSRAQAALKKQDAAWKSMQAALGYLRATAPSVPAAESRLNRDSNSVRAELKELFGLVNDDQARLAYNRYRKKATDFMAAAQTRLDLQAKLLKHAAEWGLADPVWSEIESRSAASVDDDTREPYFKTTLPSVVRALYLEADQTDKADQIESAAQGNVKIDSQNQLQRSTTKLAFSGDARQAAAQIMRAKAIADKQGDSTGISIWTMQLTAQLVKAGKPADAFSLISAMRDPVAREDAFAATSALASRLGETKVTQQWANQSSLTATERVAVYRGLVAGISATESSKTPSEPKAEETATAKESAG